MIKMFNKIKVHTQLPLLKCGNLSKNLKISTNVTKLFFFVVCTKKKRGEKKTKLNSNTLQHQQHQTNDMKFYAEHVVVSQ